MRMEVKRTKKNLVLYAGDRETVLVDLPVIGNTALYIKFVGNGAIDLKNIKFEDK